MASPTPTPTPTPSLLTSIGKEANDIVAGANFINLSVSLLFLFYGCSLGGLTANIDYDCDAYLRNPTVIFAAVLVVLSLAGTFGGHLRHNGLLGFYIVGTFLLALALFAFVIFALFVSSPYSQLLHKRVYGSHSWGTIKKCLVRSKFCPSFAAENLTLSVHLLSQNLPPLFKSGCCTPPNSCNFISKSPIQWMNNSASNLSNPDCNAWNNDPNILCFDCETCKAAVLQDILYDWRSLALWYSFSFVLLLIFGFFSCSAFHFNRLALKVHSSQHVRPSP